MNTVVCEATEVAEVVKLPEGALTEAPRQAVAAMNPSEMLSFAVSSGADLARLEKLMDLEDRWKRGLAIEAFNEAFVAFKAMDIKVLRTKTIKDGPMRGRKHASLDAVTDAVTERLACLGLSLSFKLVEDERDWMKVRCTLTHVKGHSEFAEMGGPPDNTGSKNAIQARASTKRYLARYTAEAVLGIAESDELDDDGAGGAEMAPATAPQKLIDEVRRIRSDSDARQFWLDHRAETGAPGSPDYERFKNAVLAHREHLKEVQS